LALSLILTFSRIFQNGIDVDIANLYPQVLFPVSRGTPMISPIIKWDHKENYLVPYFDSFNQFERQNVVINLNDKMFEYIQGHIIDGKIDES
jgi:fatty acid synthase, animal type